MQLPDKLNTPPIPAFSDAQRFSLAIEELYARAEAEGLDPAIGVPFDARTTITSAGPREGEERLVVRPEDWGDFVPRELIVERPDPERPGTVDFTVGDYSSSYTPRENVRYYAYLQVDISTDDQGRVVETQTDHNSLDGVPFSIPLDPDSEWRDGRQQLEGPRLDQMIDWIAGGTIDPNNYWVTGELEPRFKELGY